jgi:glycosyltransferase involved in cell wall biosynthesis
MQTNPVLPSQPTLSIVVPAYNAALFVEASLGSILPQMAPHHELVVVDDGSTDGTAARVQALAATYPACTLRLVRQPNGGVSAARNRGLHEARGDYIVFIDADDLLLPGMLAALDAAARHTPDVIACSLNAWHPEKDGQRRLIALGYPPDTTIRGRDAILHTFFADRMAYVCIYVFRREVFSRHAQPVFPPGRVYEDLAVISSLLADCASLYHLARPLIDYRQHAASITRSVSLSWCTDFASALHDVKRGLERHEVGHTVRMLADAMACYFYVAIVKNSFLLPWRMGQLARARVREIFHDSLFHPVDQVLTAMENEAIQSRDTRADAATARQVRKALAGSLMFSLMKTVSRRLKRRKD